MRYELLSSKYISSHINIASVWNSKNPFNNANEISDDKDDFDIELPTQQNDTN